MQYIFVHRFIMSYKYISNIPGIVGKDTHLMIVLTCTRLSDNIIAENYTCNK